MWESIGFPLSTSLQSYSKFTHPSCKAEKPPFQLRLTWLEILTPVSTKMAVFWVAVYTTLQPSRQPSLWFSTLYFWSHNWTTYPVRHPEPGTVTSPSRSSGLRDCVIHWHRSSIRTQNVTHEESENCDDGNWSIWLSIAVTATKRWRVECGPPTDCVLCVRMYLVTATCCRGIIMRCICEYSNLCFQTGCGAHPASCTVGTGGSFLRGKARPGRDADHSPPSSAEVKKE
jgi:hypothetical protein